MSAKRKERQQPVQEDAQNEGTAFDCPRCAVTLPEDSSKSPQDTDSDSSGEIQKGVEKPPLREDDFETLRRMVQDYKSHKLDFSNLRRRPKFKGRRVNTGISVNGEIKRRVMERAKADPDGTGGGNLSGLIELLLWTFLGCPEDVIDRGPGQ